MTHLQIHSPDDKDEPGVFAPQNSANRSGRDHNRVLVRDVHAPFENGRAELIGWMLGDPSETAMAMGMSATLEEFMESVGIRFPQEKLLVYLQNELSRVTTDVDEADGPSALIHFLRKMMDETSIGSQALMAANTDPCLQPMASQALRRRNAAPKKATRPQFGVFYGDEEIREE